MNISEHILRAFQQPALLRSVRDKGAARDTLLFQLGLLDQQRRVVEDQEQDELVDELVAVILKIESDLDL